jgi:hypothetical protein
VPAVGKEKGALLLHIAAAPFSWSCSLKSEADSCRRDADGYYHVANRGLVSATEWLLHNTRAALTGLRKKKLRNRQGKR